MSMIETFRKRFLYLVANNAAVRAKISTNFYPSFLAEVPSPTYPCANYALVTGGMTDASAANKFGVFPVRLWGHSQKHLDEAISVLTPVEAVFENNAFAYVDIEFRLMRDTTLFTLFDEQSHVYSATSQWRVQAILKT